MSKKLKNYKQNEDIAGVFMFHTKPEKKKSKIFSVTSDKL